MTMHIVERGGTHAGAQHTWAGRFLDKDTGKLGLEKFGRGEGDSDCVTKHQVGAGGGAGGGSTRPAAREHRRWSLAGDKAHEGGPHALQSGVRRLGNASVEQASGRSCSGVERESGVTGKGYCQLWTERGKFIVDDGTEEMVRCRGICTTKRLAHHHAHGASARSGNEGSRGHTSG